jgi:hypothetical protein
MFPPSIGGGIIVPPLGGGGRLPSVVCALSWVPTTMPPESTALTIAAVSKAEEFFCERIQRLGMDISLLLYDNL